MGRVLARVVAGVLLVVAVGAVALVALDSWIRDVAETRVADELRSSVPFTSTPEVTLEGYPLAWRAALNSYPAVRVRGDEMPVALDERRTMALRDVDVTLRDVSLAAGEVRAASADGDAVLTWAEVSSLAGVDVRYAGGDRVGASASVPVLGLSVTGTATGVVVLDQGAQTVALTDPELQVAGVRLPEAATDAVLARVTQPIEVPLPYGLRLDAVTPGEAGLVAQVSGSDVVFPTR